MKKYFNISLCPILEKLLIDFRSAPFPTRKNFQNPTLNNKIYIPWTGRKCHHHSNFSKKKTHKRLSLMIMIEILICNITDDTYLVNSIHKLNELFCLHFDYNRYNFVLKIYQSLITGIPQFTNIVRITNVLYAITLMYTLYVYLRPL